MLAFGVVTLLTGGRRFDRLPFCLTGLDAALRVLPPLLCVFAALR
jgi:hypothetical protein